MEEDPPLPKVGDKEVKLVVLPSWMETVDMMSYSDLRS